MNIHNIFQPGSAIESINEFSGRDIQLNHVARALSINGTSLVIYGYRGVGKSSLAQQALAVANNESETLERLNPNLRQFFNFTTISISAAYGIQSTDEAIISILSDDAGLRPFLQESTTQRIETIQAKIRMPIGQISATQAQTIKKAEVAPQIASIFKNAITKAYQETKTQIFIVIDEFDKISDQTGFANFMKFCENLPVKFCIVGISRDVQKLLKDHTSIARQIRDGSIYVPPMEKDEQEQIFLKAQAKMNNFYRFSDDAINYICECSQGHPYIIHKLGYESLKQAEKEKSRGITERIAKQGLSNIIDNNSFDLEEAYKQAVKGSAIREYILKSFANDENEEIKSNVVHSRITRETDIKKASIPTYMGHLSSSEYGSPLRNVQYGIYSFEDNIFKAYCRARPFTYWEND